MGKAARRAMLARTTAGERFDIGLAMAQETLDVLLARAEVPPGLEGEQRARWLFGYLRDLEG